ncbi:MULTISPECIES: hypothetical protein [Gemella]|uniref:hypothetical protein n=1 Tax=Gemella TaxID=1378 RepID=UPI000767F10E|nr:MULTISPECIES: hypothetical protein [Gemella]AME09654.1 hypothetical protein AXE85_05570 [Gemella sp. oral taxon 928]AXI27255.1 hypothetical protein CG018_07495 [Gemella sp. ND 6198]
MTLEIKKTTKLEGRFKVGDETVKLVTVEINDKGVSEIYESMYNRELYSKNRVEMRKHEKELREKRYEIEDKILEELEKTKQE